MTNEIPGELQTMELMKQRGISVFLRSHQLTVDIAVAVSYVVILLPGLLHSIMFTSGAESAGIGLVATIGAGIALVFRRRAPCVVFVIVLVLLLAVKTFVLGYADPLGIIIAGYSLGAYLPSQKAWVVVSAAIVVVVLSIVIGAPLSSIGIPVGSLLIITLTLFVPICLVGLIVNVVGELREAEKLQAAHDIREKVQAAELTAIRQRTVFSREMHDVVGHSLTAIINLSDGTLRASTISPETLEAGLRRINRIARDALGETRTILSTLCSEDDAVPRAPIQSGNLLTQPSFGLDRKIQNLLDTAKNTGRITKLHVRGDMSTASITDKTSDAVFRIVQEAVTNTMRHAPDATELTVILTYGTDKLTVQVIDNGRFGTDKAEGNGLRGAAGRAEELGGKLRYGTVPAGGWHVTADIPTTVWRDLSDY